MACRSHRTNVILAFDPPRVMRAVTACSAIALSVYHLYTGAFGMPEAFLHRLIHLSLALLIIYLALWTPQQDGTYAPLRQRISGLVVLVCAVVPLAYMFINYIPITRDRFPYVSDLSTPEVVLGAALVIAVIDATRRTLGPALAIVTAIFLVYPFLGPWLPGLLHHQGYSVDTFVDGLVYTTDGIFGISLGISASFVVLFVIFAAFLEACGFSQLMMAVGRGVTGTLRGGPAKMCVFASSLMGMISGSAVANVVAVGGFTIPLMKRTGYSANFAGAVEAAASTGGQFMPPVMGAQAFIMAQFTGIPYVDIVIYSTLPAILYYYSIWITIDLEARQKSLGGIPPGELGNWREDVFSRLHLLVSIAVLIALLVMGYTPSYAAVGSVASLLAMAMLVKATRLSWSGVLSALESGARYSLPVVSATAASGIIILSVTLTGLGSRFSDAVIAVAGGNLFLGLVMAMFASLVLGMGLPTVPAYIVQVGLVVPALIKMGLDPILAHLFVIYFSCLSMVTPPVAISAYAAAGLAGGDPFKTGLIACRLAIVGFIVPFMFVFDPGLLLMGTPLQVAHSAISSVLGVFALGLALQGYFYARLTWIERTLAGIAAALLVIPGLISDLCGLGFLAAVYLWQRRRTALPQNQNEAV
ncbi:MAG: TRAP transporter fused permease subunit [Rhizobiales bacterium]|nr:TRAP transporter fused permease subunit [Hyphomicrobiales bacterium]